MGEVKRLDKPNQLIQIIPDNEVTALQRKLYNCLLKKTQYIVTQKDMEINPVEHYNFEINLKEIFEITKTNKTNYDYIIQSLKSLVKTVVEYKDVRAGDEWNTDNQGMSTLLSSFESEGGNLYFSLYGRI